MCVNYGLKGNNSFKGHVGGQRVLSFFKGHQHPVCIYLVVSYFVTYDSLMNKFNNHIVPIRRALRVNFKHDLGSASITILSFSAFCQFLNFSNRTIQSRAIKKNANQSCMNERTSVNGKKEWYNLNFFAMFGVGPIVRTLILN